MLTGIVPAATKATRKGCNNITTITTEIMAISNSLRKSRILTATTSVWSVTRLILTSSGNSFSKSRSTDSISLPIFTML